VRLSLSACAVALILACGTAQAQDRTLTVTCAEAGALSVSVPADWTVEESRHDVRMPPTVTMTAPDGQVQWVVTALWKAADRKPPETLAEIRARVERTAETVGAAGAALRELPAGQPAGYYFDIGSDITPAPFTRLRQGMLRIGALTVSFTAMSAPGHDADLDAAVTRLGSARHLP
jgi:hypothetical protein